MVRFLYFERYVILPTNGNGVPDLPLFRLVLNGSFFPFVAANQFRNVPSNFCPFRVACHQVHCLRVVPANCGTMAQHCSFPKIQPNCEYVGYTS